MRRTEITFPQLPSVLQLLREIVDKDSATDAKLNKIINLIEDKLMGMKCDIPSCQSEATHNRKGFLFCDEHSLGEGEPVPQWLRDVRRWPSTDLRDPVNPDSGRNGVEMYLVQAEPGEIPLAIFLRREWAEEWKHQYSRTAVIEPWKFMVRR